MQSYLALIWDPDDSRSTEDVSFLENTFPTRGAPLQAVYRHKGVLVMRHRPVAACSHIHALATGHGVILGSLFRRSEGPTTAEAPPQLNATETQCIVNTMGRHLIDHYWGSYVAIFCDDKTGRRSLCRDPTANVACYHTKWNNVHIFFSHADDLLRYIPVPLSVNWSYLAAHLLTGGQLSRECAVNEIEDVPGGELVTVLKGNESRTILWHPAKFCVEDGLQDEATAARELRSTVVNSVQALASQYSQLLVRLSGGLDSSIVTSCLAQKELRSPAICLNFYLLTSPNDQDHQGLPPGLSKELLSKVRRLTGGADEREFARSVADKWGFRLIEREKRACEWDLHKLWTAPAAPRPSNYVYVLDEDQIEAECATEVNATACLTGEGGDTVFCNTLRAIGALDYAYLHPLGRRLFHQIAITAALSGESAARVSRKVIQHGYFRLPVPAPVEPQARPHFLTDDAASSFSPDRLRHPWVDMAASLCPGKQIHVAGVALSVPNYHLTYHREEVAISIHPLASQPVVETCLRIPTYVLLPDGMPRGLARRAFRDILPPRVLQRTSKGVQIALCQRVVRQHVDYFRECLLSGALVRERVLDPRKLEQYLVKDQPFLTVQPQQLMGYLAGEVWLNQLPAR